MIFNKSNKNKRILNSAAIFSVILSLFLIFSATSCNKKIQVENDSQIAANFFGTWEIQYKSQAELSSDPGTELELYQGEAEILSSTTITFFEDQRYQMEILAALENVKLQDTAPFTEEDVRKQVETYLLIEGTFLANKEYLELDGKTVRTIDGKITSIQEYSQIDSRVGSEKQILKWAIEDNQLSIFDLARKNAVTYRKQ